MTIASELRLGRRTIVVITAALLLIGPAAVLGNHQFSDVPGSHPFHGSIAAIAKAGITSGFSDGGYHPSEPVTRQAMAAFMHRGFGSVAFAVGDDTLSQSLAVAAGASAAVGVPVRQLVVNVPGADNSYDPQQHVYLRGHVAFHTAMGPTKGCPCDFVAIIRDITTDATSAPQYQAFESSTNTAWMRSFDVEAVFPAEPGPRTYQLEVALSFRNSSTSSAAFSLHDSSSLSAITAPFLSTGAN